MLFNSAPFLVFLLATLAFTYAVPRRWRSGVLLGASLLFYFMWIPKYLLLLLADLAGNHLLMRAMVRSRNPRRFLVAALVLGLGVLGYFKYAAFFVDSARPLLAALGLGTIQPPHILLPLGISFFTFQMLALSIDVYRGRIEPPRSFREHLLFISFFPQLIAGPIVRGWELLPQLRAGGQPTAERWRRGLWLIGAGLFKKVLLADLFLAPFVDRVFETPGWGGGARHLLAIYSFAFQIYFDFSGYTDMARGMALLFGFELPLNFLEPYLSRNPTELWRRWHVTLSHWLRDYLYIPLGGNRRGPARTYVNLLLTMLLGGLWHGAAWTFVIWGGLHGLLLALHRALGRPLDAERGLHWRDAPAILLTFHAVCFLWIFFRADTLHDALAVIRALAVGPYVGWAWLQVGVLALCALLHGLERWARLHAAELRAWLGGVPGGLVEGAAFGALAALVVLFGGNGGEFIYFQF